MTAITTEAFSGPMLRSTSASRVQRRLTELLRDGRGRAGWWVEVTRQLDDLAESVQGSAVDLDVLGLSEQLRADAPHLLGRWQRIAAERDGLYEEVTRVRRLAGDSAGDPGAVSTVSGAIRDLLQRIRRFQQRSGDVLLDAYSRDIGGE
ncbi:MAG TPA: hypothetical protein VF143_07970 [Candidatus Nanopelagicales bacterium]